MGVGAVAGVFGRTRDEAYRLTNYLKRYDTEAGDVRGITGDRR